MDDDKKKKLTSYFSLIGAIMFGDVEKTQQILDEGESVNARFIDIGYEGEKAGNPAIKETDTPLLVAVKSSAQPPIIEFLLERGADVKVKDENGRTPLAIARERNLVDVAKILESFEAHA